MKRYLSEFILKDIKNKMVFIGGPRQVGKTTLSKNVAENFFPNYQYLNWDYDELRKKILKQQFSTDNDLLIFDEIHKYKNWKNYLKGLYDVKKDTYKILVTGSARLDLYKKGGDSMLGRYYYYRLHPISLAESLFLNNDFSKFDKDFKFSFKNEDKNSVDNLNNLLNFGGFPEMFLGKKQEDLLRWHNERKKRLVKEDIRDIEFIKDLGTMQILTDILESKVGSIFSINSLREDLQVSHKTISQWISILEDFYYCYRIFPYTSSKLKSIKKESKIYLWDWSEVKDLGARFENLIASHLLKFSHFLYDVYGINLEIRFLRDLEKREVDFCLLIDSKVFALIEVKCNDDSLSKSLKYYKGKFGDDVRYFQVLQKNGVDYEENGVRVISAEKFLSALV